MKANPTTRTTRAPMRIVRKLSAARRAAVVADFAARGPSIGEQLESAGWQHIRDRDDGRGVWCRPGATDKRSAALSPDGGELFVRTTAVAGLKAGAVHDKLQVYTALHHAGDVDAATRALLSEGYGA